MYSMPTYSAIFLKILLVVMNTERTVYSWNLIDFWDGRESLSFKNALERSTPASLLTHTACLSR